MAAHLEGVGQPAVDEDAKVPLDLGVQRVVEGLADPVDDAVRPPVVVDVVMLTLGSDDGEERPLVGE